MGQGFQSYFMMREEGTQSGAEISSWGTDSGLFTSGMYFNTESMTPANEQKFLTEIGRSGSNDRGVKRLRQLGLKAEGSVEFPCYPEGGGDKAGIGLLLKHTFGAVLTGTYSGDGTKLHTFFPHDNMYGNLSASANVGAGTGRAFGITFHMGKEDDGGNIRDYPFIGNRVKSLAFTCSAGEELKCTVNTVARKAKSHGTALTVSYPTMAPFMWKDATFQLGVDETGAGGTERTIDAFNIQIENNLKEVWTMGTNVLGRVVSNGQRVVTGAYSAPYYGWVRSEYDKWVGGNSSSLNMAFVNGPYRLEFRCPKIYYTGKAPNVGGMDEQVIEMPFQAVVSTTGTKYYDIKALLVNTDSNIGFSIV